MHNLGVSKVEKKITDRVNQTRNTKNSNGNSSINISERSYALNQDNSFMFLDKTVTAFKFKGSGSIKRGQYRIPFYMTLP